MRNILIISFFLLQVYPAMAGSRDAANASSDPVYKMKLMLRQVMSEKEALNSKLIKLESELKKIKSNLKNKESKLKQANGKLKKSDTRGKKLTEKLQESYTLLTELRTEKVGLSRNLKRTTIQKKNTETDLVQCMKMNVNLFDAGQEVLRKYEKDMTDTVEPVFKLKSIDIENAVQEYQFRMEDLSIPEDKVQATIKNIQDDHQSVSAISP